MPGGVIRSIITTHSPRIGIEATAPDFTRGLIQGIRLLGEDVRAAKPDAVVLVSTHWVTTFPWYATSHAVHEGVCVADEAPDLIPGIPYKWKGDPVLGRAIVDEIAALGVMAGHNDTPHYSLDYGTVVPMQYMLGSMDETRERYTGVQYGPYGQSSASGNASVCVRPVQ